MRHSSARSRGYDYNTGESERRQVTVLFCDLVGSTPLSRQLDPEDLHEVIDAYRGTCLPIIDRYDGFVSQFMGDGMLVLFGYPRAHEEDAERAVYAGLGILEAMPEVNASLAWLAIEDIRVRIGIATGLVVVGGLAGQGAPDKAAIVGEAPNLAARVQAFAKPNTVVIHKSTHRLLAGQFECCSLGLHELKGFDTPQPLWQVMRALPVSRRFEATHPMALTPLVDRSDALGLLMMQWRRVQRGEGQTALVLGEPGIGKSRLTQELSERAALRPHIRLWYQCSPYYTNTALFPFIDQLNRAAGLRPGDTPDQCLRKLDAVLSRASDDTREALPILAELLGLPVDEPEALAALTPQRKKEKTLEALITQLDGLVARQPVLLIFEDVHWIDPTSLELIDHLSEQAPDKPMLIVLTARPGFSPLWIEREHIRVLKLERLEPDYGKALIERVAGTRQISASVLEQISERTDGVPLFIEELTKTVLASARPAAVANGYGKTGVVTTRTIPTTLQDSLMARLDQLGDAKKIAQISAVIGRRFSFAVLAALVRAQPTFRNVQLEKALQRLVDADLLMPLGSARNLDYSFRHALVRDVAYDSLLRRKREKLHAKLAAVLEREFDETVRLRPELLAHHYTEARLNEKAIEYWLEAGRRAAQRSANVEAVSQLQRALSLLSGIKASPRRDGLELALRVALGSPLISTRGPGSAEVETNYTRALQLCENLPEGREHFEAHWGWWRVSMNHRIGRARADTMLALAERLNDPGLLLQAHHCQWATLFHLGSYQDCCHHVEQGLALYDPEHHRHQAAVYGGHDAKVCGHGEHALALWLRGYPAQAERELEHALDQAAELEHAGSWAHARDYAMILGIYRGDAAAVATRAEHMIDFATQEGLPDYRERALMFRGWATARLGDARAGLKLMHQALERLKRLGTKEDLPMFLDLMAQTHQHLHENTKGLECIREAFQESEQAGLRFWLAELHRCQAKLLREQADMNEVEACLRLAVHIARQQGALTFELRAAMDLASLYQRNGRPQDAKACLAPVYERFQEELDNPELARAKVLFDALV